MKPSIRVFKLNMSNSNVASISSNTFCILWLWLLLPIMDVMILFNFISFSKGLLFQEGLHRFTIFNWSMMIHIWIFENLVDRLFLIIYRHACYCWTLQERLIFTKITINFLDGIEHKYSHSNFWKQNILNIREISVSSVASFNV